MSRAMTGSIWAEQLLQSMTQRQGFESLEVGVMGQLMFVPRPVAADFHHVRMAGAGRVDWLGSARQLEAVRLLGVERFVRVLPGHVSPDCREPIPLYRGEGVVMHHVL